MKQKFLKSLFIFFIFTSAVFSRDDSTSVVRAVTHWAGENIVLLPDSVLHNSVFPNSDISIVSKKMG